MEPIEIIVIATCILIVGSVIGTYVYKKIKHMPTGDCCDCPIKNKKFVNEYHKMNKK